MIKAICGGGVVKVHGDPISCGQAERPVEGWNDIWQERLRFSSRAKRFERPVILHSSLNATVRPPFSLLALEVHDTQSLFLRRKRCIHVAHL